ncbi:MAG: MFS transporter, partial [Chloroflexi bacterium]
AVTNLTLMMNMTETNRAGVYLGAWGFAQAVGVGTGTLLGGVIRDITLAITNQDLFSYYAVYGFEIILLMFAFPYIMELDVTRFREIAQINVTEILAKTGDAA